MAQYPISAQGVPSGTDAVATLPLQMYPAKLLRLALNGPAGSRAEVFLGGARIDQTARGFSNSNEFTHPVEIPAGTPVSVKWPGQAAKASECLVNFTIER